MHIRIRNTVCKFDFAVSVCLKLTGRYVIIHLYNCTADNETKIPVMIRREVSLEIKHSGFYQIFISPFHRQLCPMVTSTQYRITTPDRKTLPNQFSALGSRPADELNVA